jgi:hypothetical protein
MATLTLEQAQAKWGAYRQLLFDKIDRMHYVRELENPTLKDATNAAKSGRITSIVLIALFPFMPFFIFWIILLIYKNWPRGRTAATKPQVLQLSTSGESSDYSEQLGFNVPENLPALRTNTPAVQEPNQNGPSLNISGEWVLPPLFMFLCGSIPLIFVLIQLDEKINEIHTAFDDYNINDVWEQFPAVINSNKYHDDDVYTSAADLKVYSK